MEPINNNTTSMTQSYHSKKPAKVEASPSSASSAAASPRFISPMGSIDSKQGTYTVQFRDTSTGEVKSEYPRKVAMSEYSKAAMTEQGNSAKVSTSESAPAPSSEATKVSGDHKADVKV